MSDCIFCKIASGEIPSDKVYESENIVGFRDLNPIASTHILFIPKKHYEHLSAIPIDEFNLFPEIMKAIVETAQKENVVESGYRVVANINKNAGQEIFHFHMHLIGGRQLGKMG